MSRLLTHRPIGSKIAADVMTPNPQSLQEEANVREALVFLSDRGYTAAPVIDRAGRPVGVLSQSDLITHQRERLEHVPPTPEYYSRSDLATRAGEPLGTGFQAVTADDTLVRDIMTPVIFSVGLSTPAPEVARQMVGLKVHRLFVVDDDDVLVGVISALDLLRQVT